MTPLPTVGRDAQERLPLASPISAVLIGPSARQISELVASKIELTLRQPGSSVTSWVSQSASIVVTGTQ